jgi:hypothetical protein
MSPAGLRWLIPFPNEVNSSKDERADYEEILMRPSLKLHLFIRQ